MAGAPALRRFNTATSLDGLIVTTFAGEVSVSGIRILPSDEVTIAVLAETLSPTDAAILKAKLGALFAPGKPRRKVALAAIADGGITSLGPFTSQAQFLNALQSLIAKKFRDSSGVAPSPSEAYGLLDNLAHLNSSPWATLLVVGRLPEPDPQIRAYLGAYVARLFRNRRLRTSYWSPGGERCEILDLVSRETAAPVAPLEPAEILNADTSEGAVYAEIEWPDPPLREGFHCYNALLKDAAGDTIGLYTSIAVASGLAPVAPALFQELRYLAAALAQMARTLPASGETLQPVREALRRATEINPRDGEVLRAGVAIFEQQGQLKDAAAFLDALTEINPGDADLFSELGNVLFRLQDTAGAEAALSQAKKLGSKKPFVSEELGRIAITRGQFREAVPFLEECLSEDSRNVAAWLLRADCSLRIADPERAIDSIEHGLSLDPGQLAYRTRLIQLYIERKEGSKAAAHTRFVAQSPPDDAEVRAAYAQFLEKVGTSDEALDLWRRTLEIAPRMEKAHIALAQLLVARGDLAGAAAAAQAGLALCPTSSRLYLLKADAEDRQGLWQQSRSTLLAGVGAVEDLDLLRRHAFVEDQYGLRAAEAYEKLAAALKKAGLPQSEQSAALGRGLFVAVRDADMARAENFARLLREAGQPQQANLVVSRAVKNNWDVLVPGGTAAALRVMGGQESTGIEDYFRELSRIVTIIGKNPLLADEMRNRVAEHFKRVRQIESLGVRSDNGVVLRLSLQDRNARKNTESILQLLGWTLAVSSTGVKIEPSEKKSAARRQVTSAALALDEIAMQEDLESGHDFNLLIRDDKVPIILGEPVWHEAFIGSDMPAGGLSEVFAANPRLDYLYIGLARLDADTAAGLVRDIGLKTLEDKYAELLYHYSASLVVQNGRVAVPGGTAAGAVWQRLIGASPTVPKQFLSSLLRKDDGKMLAFFAALIQLDPTRQKFFTSSETRTSSFYELFRDSPDLQYGVTAYRRHTPYAEFMRQLPLDEEGHVVFPGSPEVWMIAKGQSSSVTGSTRLLKKVSRVTTPGVEDEILLRLARTAHSSGPEDLSELDNFLAVQHVEAHRSQPLDEGSALLLAQHYANHRDAWPYLTLLGRLEMNDYARFFRLSEELISLNRVALNDVVGELHALLKILCLLHDSGRIDEDHAVLLFRGICESFLKEGTAADYSAATLDMTSRLIAAAKGTGRDADEAVREALLEHHNSASFELLGKERTVPGTEARLDAFREVLDLQKVPALTALLDLRRLAGDLANSKGARAELATAVAVAVARLPEVAIPNSLEARGEAKEALNDCRLEPVRQITDNLRKEASKKKPNPKKLAALSHDLLAALNPQVRLALAGIIYAYYLSPRDLLVSEDPLFLRKHQFIRFDYPVKAKSIWTVPELASHTRIGSYIVGGFADFSELAGQASMSTSSQIGEAAKPVGAAIIGSLRETHWTSIREAELHVVALKIRAARVWVTHSADSADMLSVLSEETLGLLSPNRRADLLRALAEHQWSVVWRALTLSDLYFLGDVYLRRFREDPVTSPVLMKLRLIAGTSDPERVRWLGSNPRLFYDCSHPHLMRLAPYEYYEGFLFPDKLAARTNEFKLYLAEFADRRGLPAEILDGVGEPVALELLRNLKITAFQDWPSVLAAFSGINDWILEKALDKK